MDDLANSAGFWGERRDGHSAGRRWPKGRTENLWVAFFEIGHKLPDHLAKGLRKWMEAVAIEEHRAAHDQVPEVNGAKTEVAFA